MGLNRDGEPLYCAICHRRFEPGERFFILKKAEFRPPRAELILEEQRMCLAPCNGQEVVHI